MEDGFTGFKIGIAGLGLIGGSLAKAFHTAGFSVAGFDTDPKTVGAALSEGAVDVGGTAPKVLYDCDILFVALYPEAAVRFVKDNAPFLKSGCVVTDCCGVKVPVCEALYACDFKNITFVGGHPMAGTEQNGFSASTAALFHGASFILTPRDGEDTRVTALLEELLPRAGFAKIVRTTPGHHDRMIAFTSQLPHVLACAYVLSPSCPSHRGFSAGSFRDISRVAHINPALWPSLFIDNRKELCEEIDGMIEHMKAFRDAAQACDHERLTQLLTEARTAKDNADKEGVSLQSVE